MYRNFYICSRGLSPRWNSMNARSVPWFMTVSTIPATGSTALGARQSKTWNIPHKPCPWAPLAGLAWYFSHNFRPMPTEPIEPSADSSSNLDGLIKPSSIQRLEESQNLRPLMTTPRRARAPGRGVQIQSGNIDMSRYIMICSDI